MFILESMMEIHTVHAALNYKIEHSSHHPLKITRRIRDSIRAFLVKQDRQAQQDKNRKLWRAKERARTRGYFIHPSHVRKTCKTDNCPPCCCINGCKWIGS